MVNKKGNKQHNKEKEEYSNEFIEEEKVPKKMTFKEKKEKAIEVASQNLQ